MHPAFWNEQMKSLTGGLIFIVTSLAIILFVLVVDWCVKRKLRRNQRPSYSYVVLQHNDSSDSEFDDDNRLM